MGAQRGDGSEGDRPETQRVTGRLGAGRSLSFGWIGLLAAGLVAVAIALQNLPGTPPASPGPTSSSAIGSAGNATPKPSDGPSPSPGGPYVEPNIVDRPGVPAALYDKYWNALGQVGQVGTTARIVIPSTERIIGSDAGWVASFAVNRNEDEGTVEPVVGPSGVAVVVRDIRTGASLRTFDTSVSPEHGLGVGSLLFWTGLSLPVDAPDRSDGGVWAIDLSDPTSAPMAIVPISDLSKSYGPHAARSGPWLSDHGRAVMTTIVGDSAHATQVIDASSLSLRKTIANEIAFQIVDDLVLVERHDRVALVDDRSGAEVGPGIATDFLLPTAVGESEVFVLFEILGDEAKSGSYVSGIDLQSGAVHEIYAWKGATRTVDLSPELSAPDLLVLLPVDDLSFDELGKVLIPVTLLDPASRDLLTDAFVIGNP